MTTKTKKATRAKPVNQEFTFRSVSQSGRQKVRKIWAKDFQTALDKVLALYRHVKYFLPHITKEKMNLAEALKKAAQASKDHGRPYYVILGDKKGDCTINAAPLGMVMHKFVKGKEDMEFHERHEKEKAKSKNKATPVSHEEFKSIQHEVKKTITVMKTDKNKNNKKSAPAPAKKTSAPAKKEVKSTRVKYTDGKRVTMTNKEMTAKIKKGYIYFNEKGVNKTKYIPERPNQTLENKNYYEVAPK